MYGVIGGLLSTVFVWSTLIGNRATSVPAFEPRDSLAAHMTRSLIEFNPYHTVPNSTETPFELEPPPDTELVEFCEECSFCYQCLRKLPDAQVPSMYGLKRNLVFYSIRGDDIREGLDTFYEQGYMEMGMWRVGLRPLRVWVKGCTLIMSLFGGATPACNCDPPPDSYQIYVGGLTQLFNRNYTDYSDCSKNKRSCKVQIYPKTRVGWYIRDFNMERLTGKEIAPERSLSLPAFTLTMRLEQETHFVNKTSFVETFFALDRKELRTVMKDIVRYHRNETPELADVERFLSDKILGRDSNCYTIGWKRPNKYTFNDFLFLNKVR